MNLRKALILLHKLESLPLLHKLGFASIIALVFAVSLVMIVRAHGGDLSLIHSCVNNKSGAISIVGPNDTCGNNQTSLDWIKNVFAGAGLNIARDNTGVTLTADTTFLQKRVNGTCSIGSAISSINQDGTVNCQNTASSSDGWILSSDTWTFASATSFTISGVDRTSIYATGTKLKFTNNGSVKYAYIKSSSFSTDTTVNLVDNVDYSLVNASVTSPFYSYEDSPQGFPGFFNLALDTTNISGFSSVTGWFLKMQVVNKSVHMLILIQGGSNATTFSFPAPIPQSTNYFNVAPIIVEDNSSIQNTPGVIGFSSSGGSTIYVGRIISSLAGNSFGGFTSSGGKGARGEFSYPIN